MYWTFYAASWTALYFAEFDTGYWEHEGYQKPPRVLLGNAYQDLVDREHHLLDGVQPSLEFLLVWVTLFVNF
jgi:hypothetical protein